MPNKQRKTSRKQRQDTVHLQNPQVPAVAAPTISLEQVQITLTRSSKSKLVVMASSSQIDTILGYPLALIYKDLLKSALVFILLMIGLVLIAVRMSGR